jgi:hypothetical protein
MTNVEKIQKSVNGITSTDLLEFLEHPGFRIYNEMINVKINWYIKDLLRFDPELSKVQYSEKDVIAKQIESLTEIKKAPIGHLTELKSENTEDNALLQSIIDTII